MRNLRIWLPAILLLIPLAELHAADQAPAKPNILIILADDLGYGDVQCYNPQRGKIPTPCIDRFATQGMRFTDGHSSSGVCSPSRYTLLTGRYHWRTRLQAGIVNVFGQPLIAPDRLTIAGLARQHGYRTGAIGKWHLGWDWPMTDEQRESLHALQKPGADDESTPERSGPVPTANQLAAWREVFSKPIANGPTSHGFDSYFGTDVPNWPPYCFIENDHTVGIPSEFLRAEDLKGNRASMQGPAVKDWNLEQILPTLADRAAAFMSDAANKPEPFLLYLPLTAPHTPLAVTGEWKNKSGLNTYADFVMETDAVVGRVLDALDKSGAADHTLVIFTSDNGCAPYIGAAALEKMGHFPSGPLRGYKADVWEGGHRIPFIVRWPGMVKPGTTSGQLVLQADFMATIADVLGAKLPDNAGEDSFSFLPLLKGDDHPVRETAVNCGMTGLPGIRQGPWKLILAPGGGGFGGRGSKGDPSQSFQLYNLADDLGESKNLAADQSERVTSMQAILEKLITDGRSTPGTRQQNDAKVRRFGAAVVGKKGNK